MATNCLSLSIILMAGADYGWLSIINTIIIRDGKLVIKIFNIL